MEYAKRIPIREIREIRGRKKIQCLLLTANQANQANVALPTQALACRMQDDNI